MAKQDINQVIKTMTVTAFTIATAFIWKDVILDTIDAFVPPGEDLFYKFIVAVIATIMVLIAVYVLLKTENEAEYLLKRLMKRKDIKEEVKKIKREKKEREKKELEKRKKEELEKRKKEIERMKKEIYRIKNEKIKKNEKAKSNKSKR